MNFGAQRSRFSHLPIALKIFGIQTKQCKILCSTLKGRSPSGRTLDSSGITSSASTGPFPPPPQVTALLWAHCPPPWGSTLWAASKAQMSPQPVAQGQRGWLHMSPQPLCPSATALSPSRWAPTPGALQEQEGAGTWRMMRSAECWMQMWISAGDPERDVGANVRSCGQGFVLCRWKWSSECSGTGLISQRQAKSSQKKIGKGSNISKPKCWNYFQNEIN